MISRQIFGFNCDWKFSRRDYSVLPVQNSHMDVYNFAKAGGRLGPAAISYADTTWKTVNLPHDWAIEGEYDLNVSPSHGYRKKDVGWYRKCFELNEKDKNAQILLEFDGIATWATIYLNGSVIGRNWCGYTSFSLDITDRVFFDKPNVIAIRVDTTTWEGWWYEGAGIYRDVRLVKKPLMHIAYNGVFVKPVKTNLGLWKTDLSIEVENSSECREKCFVGVKIYDANGNLCDETERGCEIKGYEKETISFALHVEHPRLWSLEEPERYCAVCYVKTENSEDATETKYGYRTIRFDADHGFFLNEKKVVLKGTCNHQDHAGIGVAVPESVLRYRLKLLKEMGSNGYRCSHGNPDPKLLDICDEIGMLVMDENRNFDSSEEGMQQLESMIKRDRNHPSVIMYSIFNEEPLQGTLQGKRMSRRMMALTRKLDDSRPILGAMHGGFLEEESSTDSFDVIGINYRPEVYPEVHSLYPGHPICGSENNSAFSTRGIYQTDLKRQVFSSLDEEKASWGQSVREQWEFVKQNPYVSGMFVWTGFDYRGEPTPLEWPSINSHFGIMDTCGFPKDSYYLYQAYWTEKPIVHIAGDLNAGIDRIAVFSNCDTVELWFEEKLIGRQKNDLYKQTYWKIEKDLKQLTARGYVKERLCAEETIYCAGKVHTLILTSSAETIANDISDRVLIHVQAVDEKGHPCNYAEDMVHFEASDGMKVYGVGNGNPNCHEADVAAQRSLWAGKCQAIVGIVDGAKEKERFVKAWIQGMEPVKISFALEEKTKRTEIASVTEYYVTGWKMYTKLFEECPKITEKWDETDMNSYEPIEFQNRTQPLLTNQYGKYGLYKVQINMDEIPKERQMRFYHVMGEIQVYLGTELLTIKDCRFGDDCVVKLPQNISGKQILSVVMQCNNYDTQRAGICQAVVIQ